MQRFREEGFQYAVSLGSCARTLVLAHALFTLVTSSQLRSEDGQGADPRKETKAPRHHELPRIAIDHLRHHRESLGIRKSAKTSTPNIVMILVDDLDANPKNFLAMPKTRELLAKVPGSVNFTNMMAASPVCCVNRASILTGMHQHNTKTYNNSDNGGCGSFSWQEGPEKQSFATLLKERGYYTGYYGKYLNTYGDVRNGGMERIPPGWDKWLGLKGNSKYYNYTVSRNGVKEEHLAKPRDYFTDVISRSAKWFLQNKPRQTPFALVVSPPAAHGPWEASPKYRNKFMDVEVPRPPNWNCCKEGKHHLVETRADMEDDLIKFSDLVYRRRLQTLLSVDDLVDGLMQDLTDQGDLNNTFIFFTSDNGFHSGQFSFPIDKRLPYESDIRVPLLVRTPYSSLGPRTNNDLLSSVDLAATFLHIAGVYERPRDVPRQRNVKHLDGISFLQQLQGFAPSKTRREALVEYMGENKSECHVKDLYFHTNPQFSFRGADVNFSNDETANTYICIRRINTYANDIFCRFYDTYEDRLNGSTPAFEEYYDLMRDPYQLNNEVDRLSNEKRNVLEKRFNQLLDCQGSICHTRLADK